MPHFIYCGEYYVYEEEKLKLMILTKMRKYEIQSSIVTMLHMWRLNLVTKEKVKKAYKGKLKNDFDWEDYEGSINDDLEAFFINLRNQKEGEKELYSFFTSKLTNEELKLVQEGNEEHLNTYLDYLNDKNPDVDVEEMKKSDSKSKYVHGRCWRRTIPLRLETIEFEDQTESEYETETQPENEVEVPDTKKRKMHE